MKEIIHKNSICMVEFLARPKKTKTERPVKFKTKR